MVGGFLCMFFLIVRWVVLLVGVGWCFCVVGYGYG